MLGAVWGPNAGRTLYWAGECVWGYIMWLGVKEYPTPPWIPHPTSHFRQGYPVTSTCAKQNRGLVQFSYTNPHLSLPPVCSPPKFYLKLDLLTGLLEFHGNLLWFEDTSWYFPLLITRSRMWAVNPGLDNDFRVFSPTPPYCFVLGLLSDKRFTSSVFVEGLLCGRPFAGRWGAKAALGDLLVQFNSIWWPWRRGWSSSLGKDIGQPLSDFLLTLSKEEEKESFL